VRSRRPDSIVAGKIGSVTVPVHGEGRDGWGKGTVTEYLKKVRESTRRLKSITPLRNCKWVAGRNKWFQKVKLSVEKKTSFLKMVKSRRVH